MKINARDSAKIQNICDVLMVAANMAEASGDRYAEVNAKDLRRYTKIIKRIFKKSGTSQIMKGARS